MSRLPFESKSPDHNRLIGQRRIGKASDRQTLLLAEATAGSPRKRYRFCGVTSMTRLVAVWWISRVLCGVTRALRRMPA